MVKIMNESSLVDQTGGGMGDQSMLKENENTNILLSATRQILDVSHKNIFQCCSIPVLIEMNLIDGPVYDPSRKFEAVLNFISGSAKQIQAIKLSLIVRIEIRDLNKRIIESTDTEVLSATKLKPFNKKEQLVIDLEKYKEIVEAAKNEFKLHMRLDYSAGLLKNENPIKTMNVKRANRDRDETAEGAIRKSVWG